MHALNAKQKDGHSDISLLAPPTSLHELNAKKTPTIEESGRTREGRSTDLPEQSPRSPKKKISASLGVDSGRIEEELQTAEEMVKRFTKNRNDAKARRYHLVINVGIYTMALGFAVFLAAALGVFFGMSILLYNIICNASIFIVMVGILVISTCDVSSWVATRLPVGACAGGNAD